MELVIGTRGSELAQRQTALVRAKILAHYPGIRVRVKIISTKGDRDLRPIPIDTVGKGWFTREVEIELIEGKVDLAVHSLKDLPESLPEELAIAAVMERGDPRDVLVSKTGNTLAALPKGAIIGTDSERRKHQILRSRPDCVLQSVRGNVVTRLEKLFSGSEYDALVLAAAGLARLGEGEKIAEYFDPAQFVPAPGQGTLAVEIRKDNQKVMEFMRALDHAKTRLASEAERSFSSAFGGGCKLPVGAYAAVDNGRITLHGMAAEPGTERFFLDTIEGNESEAEELGRSLAQRARKTIQA